MSILNLTPHSVQVYKEEQFINLEQVNPTTLYADSVDGTPLAEFESCGIARIAVSTEKLTSSDIPGEIVKTEYGEANGIPENVKGDDVLIVSIPTKSMSAAAGHPLSSQMVSPYKVVRSRENSSLVLGCIGFTY